MSNFQDIINDWLKFGTMMVVARIFSGESLQDTNWQRVSLFTLLGFTSYHVFFKNLLDTSRFGDFQPIADTWLKFGTMMVVERLLTGSSLMDRKWQLATLYTLIGFTTYHLLTSRFVKGEYLTTQQGLVSSINDWAFFGTMLVVSQILGGGSLLDKAWQSSSVGTLLGFTAYNLLSNL